jgi:sulfur-oxidizing protein SoxX
MAAEGGRCRIGVKIRFVNRRHATLFHGRAALAVACTIAVACCAAQAADSAKLATAIAVVGDAIPAPLSGAQGDAGRGRALLLAHEDANCVLCHTLSDPGLRFSGNIGPSLDGVGKRLSPGQLRLRVADYTRVNSASVMPSYYRVDGLDRVASMYRGQPILDAGQIEDIVAYLTTLK